MKKLGRRSCYGVLSTRRKKQNFYLERSWSTINIYFLLITSAKCFYLLIYVSCYVSIIYLFIFISIICLVFYQFYFVFQCFLNISIFVAGTCIILSCSHTWHTFTYCLCHDKTPFLQTDTVKWKAHQTHKNRQMWIGWSTYIHYYISLNTPS